MFGLHPIYSIGGSAKEAREKWLREMFQSADVNNDGLMDEEESISLIKTLSDGVRDNVIKNKLHEYLRNKKADNTNAENGSDGLTIEEFIELFKDVATRPEVYFTLGMFTLDSGIFWNFDPVNGT